MRTQTGAHRWKQVETGEYLPLLLLSGGPAAPGTDTHRPGQPAVRDPGILLRSPARGGRGRGVEVEEEGGVNGGFSLAEFIFKEAAA